MGWANPKVTKTGRKTGRALPLTTCHWEHCGQKHHVKFHFCPHCGYITAYGKSIK